MHLVINSYGSALSKENGLFAIQNADGRQTFPADIIKSITLFKGTKVTSDAILLAIENKIDILFNNDLGIPQGRIWSIQYGSISSIRKAQVNFIYSSEVVAWVKKLLAKKIEGQLALLHALQPSPEENLKQHNLLKSAINSMADYSRKINALDAETLSDVAPTLRGWEGAAGRKYFAALQAMLPPAYAFEKRDRRPAGDPFNAMLNYAYGILYTKVEGALIKAGLDPYVGIFHRDEYNRPALAYDFIETYRIWMDYVVYQLCAADVMPNDAFEKQEETGGILLTPFARRILIQSVNDYLSEIIALGGNSRSRQTMLEYDAFALAKYFLKFEEHDLDRP